MQDLLKKLRKAHKISQEEMANKLGMSRPTLIALEKGDRDITLTELRKVSETFDVPIEILLDEEISTEEKFMSQNNQAQSLAAFHNLVLQCIKYGADDDGKITKTKLAKLVYLCDFACYYNFLSPISGFEYKRLKRGPVTIEFLDMVDQDESITSEQKGNAILLSLNEEPSDSVLQKDQLDIVKKVCTKWKTANTKEIVDFTHAQLPWSVCRDREVIPYELISMEEPENVY